MFNIENLEGVLRYGYDQELAFLEEELGQELPDSLEDAIKICKDRDLEHLMGYRLMVLKVEIANYHLNQTPDLKCPHCDSLEVDVQAWQNVNTEVVYDYVGEHEAKCYCNGCQKDLELNELVEV